MQKILKFITQKYSIVFKSEIKNITSNLKKYTYLKIINVWNISDQQKLKKKIILNY